jgi:hypothetical protein
MLSSTMYSYIVIGICVIGLLFCLVPIITEKRVETEIPGVTDEKLRKDLLDAMKQSNRKYLLILLFIFALFLVFQFGEPWIRGLVP